MSNQEDEPLLLERLDGGELAFIAECVDLDSEPTYRLINKRSKEEFAVSQEMIETIRLNHWLLESDIRKKQEELKRLRNHPIHRFPRLSYPIEVNAVDDKNPRQVYFISRDLLIGTPMLLWGKAMPGNEKSNLFKLGWRLTFHGYEKASLGFAEWSDTKMIDTLSNKLFQPKELLITYALTDPKEARELTSLINAERNA